MRWLLGFVLLVAFALVGLRLYLSRGAEDRVTRGEEADFQHLQFAHRENVYLMCPSQPVICNQPADAQSPTFAMDVDRLRVALLKALAAEPRLKQVSEDKVRHRLVFIQRSLVLRFPDIVTVELIPLEGERSTLAILSRSRYGRKDFGVNAARVDRWIANLKAATGP